MRGSRRRLTPVAAASATPVIVILVETVSVRRVRCSPSMDALATVICLKATGLSESADPVLALGEADRDVDISRRELRHRIPDRMQGTDHTRPDRTEAPDNENQHPVPGWHLV